MKIVISGMRAEGKTTLAILITAFLESQGFIVRPQRHIQRFTSDRDTPATITPRIVEISELSGEEVWSGRLDLTPEEISP